MCDVGEYGEIYNIHDINNSNSNNMVIKMSENIEIISNEIKIL